MSSSWVPFSFISPSILTFTVFSVSSTVALGDDVIFSKIISSFASKSFSVTGLNCVILSKKLMFWVRSLSVDTILTPSSLYCLHIWYIQSLYTNSSCCVKGIPLRELSFPPCAPQLDNKGTIIIKSNKRN